MTDRSGCECSGSVLEWLELFPDTVVQRQIPMAHKNIMAGPECEPPSPKCPVQ